MCSLRSMPKTTKTLKRRHFHPTHTVKWAAVIQAAKATTHVLLLAAVCLPAFANIPRSSLVAEKPHQGSVSFALVSHRAESVANALIAPGLPGCLYDLCVKPCSSGKERDAETGLDYFLARYYSAAQGRFTSPDEWAGGIVDPFTGQQVGKPGPLPYADITDPQTINKYAYVRNNPLRYTDPDGHVIDTLADIAFIGYDIYDIAKNGATVTSVLALGADVVGAVVPFATGLGAGVRAGREGVVLTVKAKEGWSAAQKAEAAAKIEALNKTEMVVTKSERSATSAASRYKKAGNRVDSAVQDVDHVHDLQLGGKDAVGNMKPIDKSVNRSLGPQIQNEIKRKGLKEGDKVCRMDFCQ